MASTSQISNSLHSRRRANNPRPLKFFFGAAVILVLAPVGAVIYNDTTMRQEIADNAHNMCANISGAFTRLSTGKNLATSTGATQATKLSTAATSPAVQPTDSLSSTGGSATVARGDNRDVSVNVSMMDQAVQLLNDKIAADPNNPSLHNRLGLIYASVGELRDAQKQFNLAIDYARQKLADANAQIQAKKEAGQIEEASEIMLSANQMEVELSSAHSNLARVFEKLGQQSKVVAQLDQLNKDVTIGSGPAAAVAAAVANAPADPAHAKKVSSELVTAFSKAQADLQSGRAAEAAQQLRAVLAIDPDFAQAHEQLGTIALSQGNTNQAIEELARAKTLDPAKASTHAALGVAYQYKGKMKEAIAEFSRAVVLDPKDASSAFNLGNAYAASNRAGEAIGCYQKAIAINPGMAVAHNNLASLYCQKGNLEAAVKEFEQAISLAPTMASAHYGLGIAYFRGQNYSSASRAFKQALTLDPGLVDAHHKLAMCERQVGSSRQHLHQDVAMR